MARSADAHAVRTTAGLAAAVTLALGLATMTADPVGVFFDDGLYLLAAQSLAAGEGYRFPHLPGSPPAVHYPPLWPILLAVVTKLTPSFPANIVWLKLLNPLLLAAASFGATCWGARVLGGDALRAARGAALIVVIATAAAPLLALTNVLFSEPLFLALCFPALIAVDRAVNSGESRHALQAGLLIALCALARTLGLALLPAALLALVLAKRHRAALLCAGSAMLLLAPWLIWSARAARELPAVLDGSYGPYLDWVLGAIRAGGASFVLETLAQNLRDLARVIGVVFGAPLPLMLRPIVVVAVIGLAIGGAWQLRQRSLAALGFFGIYLAAVLGWPFRIDRFLFALWPLVLLLLLAGARPLLARGLAVRVAVVGLFALHLGYVAPALARGWSQGASARQAAKLWPVVTVVRERVPRTTRVASDAHVMLALYGGYEVVPVDILTAGEHLRPKGSGARRAALRALDAEYAPELFAFTSGSPEGAVMPFAPRAARGRLVGLPSPAGTPQLWRVTP